MQGPDRTDPALFLRLVNTHWIAMTVSDCQESAKSDLFGSDIEFGACDFGKRDYNTFLAKGEPPMKKQNQNYLGTEAVGKLIKICNAFFISSKYPARTT